VNLVPVMNVAKSLDDFIDNELGEALCDVNLHAAAEALKKSSSASDKKSQIWSVINHLESAEASISSSYYNRFNSGTSPYGAENNLAKLKYILTLMAICYMRVSEEELAGRTLYKIRTLKTPEQLNPDTTDQVIMGFLGVFRPSAHKAWIEQATGATDRYKCSDNLDTALEHFIGRFS